MTLKSEVSKGDYSKLMTAHLLKTPSMILVFIMGLASLVFYFQHPEFGLFYLFLGIGFDGIPILLYFTVGRAYDSNKHFNERLEFIIDKNNLELVGQTFRSTFTWGQITKVEETEKFFSLHQGRMLLTLINKTNNSQDSIDSLRRLMQDKGKIK